MNKYLKRGLLLLIAGAALIGVGYLIKNDEDINLKYGWAMIIGFLLFGIGFLSIVYRLIRKVERDSILEERSNENNDAETP